MDTTIQEAASWFEKRYHIQLPPIYLNKSIEFSHYARNGKYGCLKGDWHICLSVRQQQEYGLLAFFHEAEHILLNRDIGRIVQDDEPDVEALVTEKAKADLKAFKSRYTHAT